jgi:hypothetical protein
MTQYKNNTNVLLHKYGNHYGGFDCTLCTYNTKRREGLVKHAAKVHQRVLDRLEDYCHTPKRQRVAMTSQAMLARISEADLPITNTEIQGTSHLAKDGDKERPSLPTTHQLATPVKDTSDSINLDIPSPLNHTIDQTTSQLDCAKHTGNTDIVVEIVEADVATSTLPVISFQSITDSLTRIRGKNMLRGIEKMVEIHNDLLRLEAELDQDLLDAVIMHQQD